jgi:hypothetical protein
MLMITTIDRRGKRSDATLQAFMPGWSSRAAAHALHTALSRYQCGAWRRHRIEDQCPARLCGKLEAHCWHILRARDAVPSERTIRAAIDAARNQKLPGSF